MIKSFALISCFLAVNYSRAQDERFAADRPGLSDAPDLIVKNSWQIASGFDISRYNFYGIYQLSQNTLKYGISNRFEARIDFSLQYDQHKKKYGSAPPSIGLKTLLFRQQNAVPKAALILEYYPPSLSTTQQSSGLAAELCFSHNLKNGNSLYYNIGSNWAGSKQDPVINSLLGFSFSIDKKINPFVEFYAYRRSGEHVNYVSDIGTTYLLNKKLQLDLAFGLDLMYPDGNYYFDGGVTYNF